MPENRSHRFLIDKIDERLGDVRKEIKFDIAAIIVSVILIAAASAFLCLASSKGFMVLALMILLAGVSLLYAMTKELISDYRRAKKEGKL